MLRSVIKGVGAYLPERVLTNKELAKNVDTSDEWIVARSGIHQRHIAADDQFPVPRLKAFLEKISFAFICTKSVDKLLISNCIGISFTIPFILSSATISIFFSFSMAQMAKMLTKKDGLIKKLKATTGPPSKCQTK